MCCVVELGYIPELSWGQRQLHSDSFYKNKSVTTILTHLVFLIVHALFDASD
jgi:hypothetical protein